MRSFFRGRGRNHRSLSSLIHSRRFLQPSILQGCKVTSDLSLDYAKHNYSRFSECVRSKTENYSARGTALLGAEETDLSFVEESANCKRPISGTLCVYALHVHERRAVASTLVSTFRSEFCPSEFFSIGSKRERERGRKKTRTRRTNIFIYHRPVMSGANDSVGIERGSLELANIGCDDARATKRKRAAANKKRLREKKVPNIRTTGERLSRIEALFRI